MLPKKYHAIAFLSTLLMLLLLGLHLLGFSFLGGAGSEANGAAGARSAALARNSTGGGGGGPTGASSTLNPNAVYRHPIVYDKLTGSTNNQITEVLGATKQASEQPLDHYQQQQQQHQASRALAPTLNPFDQFPGRTGDVSDPFTNHLQAVGGRPFMGGPPHAGSMHAIGPPPLHRHRPLPLPLQVHQHLLTTPAPPPPPPPQPLQPTTSRNAQQQAQGPASQQDSLPLASSLNNNGSARAPNASLPSQPQAAHYFPQQQQPVYYTPPIFTYSNPSEQAQPPPLGVPEVPLSVDEFNSRQDRLRQLQPTNAGQSSQDGRPQPQQQPVNLLADPQAQQRHKQQLLDRPLLFSERPAPFPSDSNFTNAAAYYPDPAALHGARGPLQPGSIRPPYAHQMGPAPAAQQAAQSRHGASGARGSSGPPSSAALSGGTGLLRPVQFAPALRSGQQSARLAPSSSPPPQSPPPPAAAAAAGQEPACARQLTVSIGELASPANGSLAAPALVCTEDADYPTSEIMRALEAYASDRPIEQLLPQTLVQMLTASGSGRHNPETQKLLELQRSFALDPLQANTILGQGGGRPALQGGDRGGGGADDEQTRQQVAAGVFPSANFEPLCQASAWLAQPRRAKTLAGPWKVVVNLPGHKYRGVAISQIVRLEECSRPGGECLAGSKTVSQAPPSVGGKSRCLQQYANQQLLAWSHQQGLHLDLFRVPIGCSCHIRRAFS